MLDGSFDSSNCRHTMISWDVNYVCLAHKFHRAESTLINIRSNSQGAPFLNERLLFVHCVRVSYRFEQKMHQLELFTFIGMVYLWLGATFNH